MTAAEADQAGANTAAGTKQENWERFWHVLGQVGAPHLDPDLSAFGDLLIRTGVKQRVYDNTAPDSSHTEPTGRQLRQAIAHYGTVNNAGLTQQTGLAASRPGTAKRLGVSNNGWTNRRVTCDHAAQSQLAGLLAKQRPVSGKAAKQCPQGQEPGARFQNTRRHTTHDCLPSTDAHTANTAHTAHTDQQEAHHPPQALPRSAWLQSFKGSTIRSSQRQRASVFGAVRPPLEVCTSSAIAAPATECLTPRGGAVREVYNAEVPRALPGHELCTEDSTHSTQLGRSATTTPRGRTTEAPGTQSQLRSLHTAVPTARHEATHPSAQGTNTALVHHVRPDRLVDLSTQPVAQPTILVSGPTTTHASATEGNASNMMHNQVPKLRLGQNGLSTGPEGAYTKPGKGKDKESYWGGLLHDSELMSALMSALAGPQGNAGVATHTAQHAALLGRSHGHTQGVQQRVRQQGMDRSRHVQQAQSGQALPAPDVRWRAIQEGIDRLVKRQAALDAASATELGKGSRAATSTTPPQSSLLSWGAAWRDTLSSELREVMPRSAALDADKRRELMNKVQSMLSCHRSIGPGSDQAVLTDREAALRDVNTALDLMDAFTRVCPPLRRHRLADQVEAAATAPRDPLTGLRALPPPPPAFPASAAWDYLVCAQVAMGGLAGCEDLVQTMREKIQVMMSSTALSSGLAASSALVSVEAELGIQELAAVRSVSTPRAYLVSECADSPLASPRTLTTPRSTHTHTPPHHTHEPRSPTHLLFTAAPTHNTHTASRSLGGALTHHTTPHNNTHSNTHLPQQHTATEGGGAGYITTRYSTCSTLHSPRHVSTHTPRSPRPFCDAMQGHRHTDDGGGVAAVSTQQTPQQQHGSACDAPAPQAAWDRALLEDMWLWLESILIETHAAADARDGVRGAARAAAAAQAADPSHTHVNPHTSEVAPVNAVSNLVDQVAKLQAALALPGELGQAALAQLKSDSPYTDQAALRAATLTHFSPDNLERVLHYLLQLAACVEKGSLPPRDSGFLLVCVCEIVLGELQWLLTLCRVCAGPASPHLRALHAALRAHDAQAEYNVLLAERVDELTREYTHTLTRARTAERRVDELSVCVESLTQSHTALTSHNKELERDNEKLMERIRELECQVHTLTTDPDVIEQRSLHRTHTLKEAEAFSKVSKGWWLNAVSRCSKAVQAPQDNDDTHTQAPDTHTGGVQEDPRRRLRSQSTKSAARGAGRVSTAGASAGKGGARVSLGGAQGVGPASSARRSTVSINGSAAVADRPTS